MKITIFLFILIVAYAENTADTPNILIGSWSLDTSSASTSSDCCIPADDMKITMNDDYTITLTSDTWVGAQCDDSMSSITLNFNGTYSYNILKSDQYNSTLYDVLSGDSYLFDMDFTSTMTFLGIQGGSDETCVSNWYKFSTIIETSAIVTFMIFSLFLL